MANGGLPKSKTERRLTMANTAVVIDKFLTQEISARELEILLAKIEFEYTMLAMGVNIAVEPAQAGEAIYHLHRLREILKSCQ